ncbi:inosine/guanosine kinase [Psychrosphaera sp. B3R10]|uniref:inosine/guanosine kinase n=1 Tax=unclassified Psychrosphaera TaxID=2641570 RepID=UPI001C0802D2|nr:MULTISPECIES: inosine/guanosine kinase [unclassified Psychrosphaera]MBU2881114.1 inosine/guanosine kinase [Psychrosphaera sp. I2R16]MBU2990038.1 inosine/guanosine kinase [Psychrosphaera sp. B3R10]MDO6721179.1 inosine/guanosine kinase [Psychrosphaera sp. 1_MG-2023]
MRFPGRRKYKHYFPVEQKDPVSNKIDTDVLLKHPYVVGIDQTIVDIEADVSQELLDQFSLKVGQSQLVAPDLAEKLYEYLLEQKLITDQHAGGTIGNTLHNYSVLADDRSVLYGVMSKNIQVGNYAYRYLCNTSSKVDLQQLQPVDGAIGRAFTLITPDGERTFAIDSGVMNKLTPDFINEDLIKNASAFVISAYFTRCTGDDTLDKATLQAIEYANKHNVPVVLSLGTRFVIEEKPQWWRDFIKQHVQIIAMNEDEAEALVGSNDPLIACERMLELVDLVLCTAGPVGLYMAGYTDEKYKRETQRPLLPSSISEFNRYEFSRPLSRAVCDKPIKIYSYIAPYMGGPEKITNTNGAGDGALAALLHDIAAIDYHRMNVPESSKHVVPALTYSSLAQICKYANRVSFEVLSQSSPRLSKGLPEREDNLESAYWH